MSLKTRAILVVVIGLVMGVSLSVGGGIASRPAQASNEDLALEHLLELVGEVRRDARVVDEQEVVRVVPQVGHRPVGGAEHDESSVHHDELVVHDVRAIADRHGDLSIEHAPVAGVVPVVRVTHHAHLHPAVVRHLDGVDDVGVGEAHDGEVDGGFGV